MDFELNVVVEIADTRPAFDHLTMQTEWVDWLNLDGGYNDETGPAPAALVAEMTRQHNMRFFNSVASLGMLWDDLEGTFTLSVPLRNKIADGEDELVTHEHLDDLWTTAFETVSLTQDATEQMLMRRGLM